jgi:tRNA(fMet)-specific endonuclease VapC
MKYLLDTSVYSQPIKKRPLQTVVDHWKSHPESEYAVSAICELEVLYGIKLAASERLTKAYHSILKGRFPILPFDEVCAALYAELQATFVTKGQTRPAFDLMIAATAIENGLELATCNAADFQNIPGLIVRDWSLQAISR